MVCYDFFNIQLKTWCPNEDAHFINTFLFLQIKKDQIVLHIF